MQYGYLATNFDYCGNARTLVELAKMAEDAGWDGSFTWDHIQNPDHEPAADPWVAFGAIAACTERFRFGPMVTPIPRRHIAKLAREATTLDHLPPRALNGTPVAGTRNAPLCGLSVPAGSIPGSPAVGSRVRAVVVVNL